MPQIINRHGQNISPLQGLFYRTLYLLEKGIKPVFVFDGKPPDLKQAVLAKRAAIAGAAKEAEDSTRSHFPQRIPKQDSETLLSCLGVPYIQAERVWFGQGDPESLHGRVRIPTQDACSSRPTPTPLAPKAPAEAEATCAALVKSGLAFCTATEDMDALPFGSVRLLRRLNAKKGDLEEISLPVVLEKLSMTHEQFVDLCILLGCDYCEKIRGLGPKKALKLLQQHRSIEQVLQHTCRQKHPLPANWPLEDTRRLFLQPEVAQLGQVVLEWREPDEERLVQFLAREKHMKESRVRHRMGKWRESRQKHGRPELPQTAGSPRQRKIGEFFRVKKRHSKALSQQPRRKRKASADQPEVAAGT